MTSNETNPLSPSLRFLLPCAFCLLHSWQLATSQPHTPLRLCNAAGCFHDKAQPPVGFTGCSISGHSTADHSSHRPLALHANKTWGYPVLSQPGIRVSSLFLQSPAAAISHPPQTSPPTADMTVPTASRGRAIARTRRGCAWPRVAESPNFRPARPCQALRRSA